MREMASSRDYGVPRLNGLAYHDKPFLYFAAGAQAIHALGPTETAARLPSLIFALGSGVLLALFSRRWFDFREGWAIGLALVCAPLPLVFSQIVIFDSMLAFCMTTAILAFHRCLEASAGRACTGWGLVGWIGVGLGTLTKGPVAVFVPLVVVLLWARLSRRPISRLWRRGVPLSFVAIILPWLLVVSADDRDYLRYVFVVETLGRIGSDRLGRDGPVWYYIPVLTVGALPWSFVCLAGWRDLWRAWLGRDEFVRFLLCWLLMPFVFFSLIRSKLPHYILPLIPALVLCGFWVWRRQPRGHALAGTWLAISFYILVGGAFCAVGFGKVEISGLPADAKEILEATAFSLAAAWFLAAIAAFLVRRSPAPSVLAHSLPSLSLLLLTAPLLEVVGSQRSARDLGRVLASRPPGAGLVAIERFPSSLPFYFGRPLTVASGDGEALRSNYIVSRYDAFVDTSPFLRSPTWLGDAIRDCTEDRAFLVAKEARDTRSVLENAGRRVVAEALDVVVYGACRGVHDRK